MNRIKELRLSKGWTQDELGEKLCVKRSTISKYETNRIPLTDDIIKKLSEIFDKSADYILGFPDISLINGPELSLSQKVALELVESLEKAGYNLEEKDLDDLILVSKIALEQKKNKK